MTFNWPDFENAPRDPVHGNLSQFCLGAGKNFFRISQDLQRSLDGDRFQMPDKFVALLIRFLEQNEGNLSKRAREKEFSKLTDAEAIAIEEKYREVMI